MEGGREGGEGKGGGRREEGGRERERESKQSTYVCLCDVSQHIQQMPHQQGKQNTL